MNPSNDPTVQETAHVEDRLEGLVGHRHNRYLFERFVEIRTFREVDDGGPAHASSALVAWGSNTYGQLGDGSTIARRSPVWAGLALEPRKIIAPVVGDWTLALATDSTAWAWGTNVAGQLGDGTLVANRATPSRVGLPSSVVDIAAGPSHGVAVLRDGSVWQWGLPNPFAAQPDWLPVQVPGLRDIASVAAGWDFTLALRRDGRVLAWGANGSGQLGDGSTTPRSLPTPVAGLTAVRAIAAGYSSSYAIKSNGAVVAWGAGRNLGDGATVDRLTPVPVPSLIDIEQISVGDHALARTTAGAVWFWGSNYFGQSGDGTSSGVRPTPVRVPNLQWITGIAVGGRHSIALQSDGTVWAWGFGGSGEIGVDPVYIQSSPIRVPLPDGRRAAAVGAGERTSFAIVG